MAAPEIEVPVFGSAHRAGRDEADYQASRLRMLSRFSLRLAAAYDRQVRHLWKEFYRLGASWNEQRAFIGRLEEGNAEKQKLIRSQQDWIATLEQERDRLWAEVQRLGKAWEEQGSQIRQQADQAERIRAAMIDSIQRQAALGERVAELEQQINEHLDAAKRAQGRSQR